MFKTLLRRAAKNYTEDNFKNYSGASPKNCAENSKKTMTLNARRAFYFYYLPYFISFRSAGYQCAGPYMSTFSVFLPSVVYLLLVTPEILTVRYY